VIVVAALVGGVAQERHGLEDGAVEGGSLVGRQGQDAEEGGEEDGGVGLEEMEEAGVGLGCLVEERHVTAVEKEQDVGELAGDTAGGAEVGQQVEMV
jgi:hypothetical protein